MSRNGDNIAGMLPDTDSAGNITRGDQAADEIINFRAH